MPINPSVLAARKLWVAALRSGEYMQGRYVLKEDDKYCCLGVACDLYNQEHNTKLCFEIPIEDYEDQILDGELGVVADWLGINEDGSFMISGNSLVFLGSLNDDGVSFDNIAKVIETYLINENTDYDISFVIRM